jgi:pyruvate,water dikinase
MNRPIADWVNRAGAPSLRWHGLSSKLTSSRHGAKASNLGRMATRGLSVPQGIVLGIDVLEAFLDETGLHAHVEALKSLSLTSDAVAFDAAAECVRAGFEAAAWPVSLSALLDELAATLSPGPVWVVRSSAVGEDGAQASYAGLMDSVLGVTTRDQLEAAVRRVWASRWSARALAYEQTHGALGSIAVIVQRQIDPAFAGVLFTRSPEPGQGEAMLCEYCAGLADKLVAGEITPARMRIDRDRIAIVDTVDAAASARPSDRSIRDLAQAALAAERLFGGPQDIEFAIDRDGKVWLVQARPITTPVSALSRRVVWSNANVNENFPDPISPLLYSVVGPGYGAYFRNLGRAFGLSRARLERMRGDLAGIVGVHAGRLYYNLTAIHAVLREAPFGDRLCAWFDDFTGAADPARSPVVRHRSFVRSARDAAELLWIAMRTTWQYIFVERRVRAFEARVDAYATSSSPERLAKLDTIELRDLLRGFVDIRMRRWTEASLADAAAMVCYGVLKALVAKAVDDDAATGLHNDLLKGLSGLKSAEPVEALWQLARCVTTDPELQRLFAEHEAPVVLDRLRSDVRFRAFGRQFDAYLHAWGFRCSGELMLTTPSFQEQPEALIDMVRCCAEQANDAPQARLAGQRAERESATRKLMAIAGKRPLFGKWPWPSMASVLQPVMTAAQASIGLRERARLKQALLYSRLRRVALELGARLAARRVIAAPGDVFFLTMAELDEWLSGAAMFPDDVGALVELRQRTHASFAAHRPADVLVSEAGDYPRDGGAEAAMPTDGSRLVGTSVCRGRIVGPARVLTDVAQTRTLRKGDVLVTRQTDPGWAPAFVLIGGLVLERGGMLSHGAILAREYGIPTVVGVPGATERIASERSIEVDGDRGEVRLLDA